MKYTSIIQNGGSSMEDDSRPFFNSEVIMTSLLLLKIVNEFVNLLILTSLPHSCFESHHAMLLPCVAD